MNRNYQVEFCRRCTRKLFNSQQGLLCSLTGQKADFETECSNYVPDQAKAAEIHKKQMPAKKRRLAFGLNPGQSDNLLAADLDQKQLFVVAYHAAKSLKWDIGQVSESGFFAYTDASFASWSEQIEISIGIGNVSITSECLSSQIIDWGKNAKNIRKYRTAFDTLKAKVHEIDANAAYEEIATAFAGQSAADEAKLEKSAKINGFFSMLIPAKGYFVTPILVLLNILMFIAMVVAGVSILMPGADELLFFGGNLRALTINGDWWRLISCVFVHAGIFHLIMNMYALIYIGLLLEPYLGKWGFLSAFLLTGVCASVTSLLWNDVNVSVGASGAIFGMYGVFLALLTTKLIEKAARKSLLLSIGLFVMFNLMNGFRNQGIDNAAHLGGLVSGFIVGFSFYPGLVKSVPRLKVIAIAILATVITLGSWAALKFTSSDLGKYQAEMEKFAKYEQEALSIFNIDYELNDMEAIDAIRNTGIRNWRNCISIIEKVEKYKLPDGLKLRNEKLKAYCEIRIKIYELMVLSLLEDTNRYDQEIYGFSQQIESLVNELSSQ